MSLSKQCLSTLDRAIVFDVAALGSDLKEACPAVGFALLMGSARDGTVPAGGDLDIALHLGGRPTQGVLLAVVEVAERQVPGVHCDVGVLDGDEPVYRFEALKGTLLFARDREQYLRFFSVTCREYESQLAESERQYRYRTEAA